LQWPITTGFGSGAGLAGLRGGALCIPFACNGRAQHALGHRERITCRRFALFRLGNMARQFGALGGDFFRLAMRLG